MFTYIQIPSVGHTGVHVVIKSVNIVHTDSYRPCFETHANKALEKLE